MQFNNNIGSLEAPEVLNKPTFKKRISIDRSIEGIEKKMIVVDLLRTPEKKADLGVMQKTLKLMLDN
jgi:hypothetical protein